MSQEIKKDVFVKHVNGNVYDAFWGSGWSKWTRFLYRRNEVTYIKGQFINAEDKITLRDQVQALNVVPAPEENVTTVLLEQSE